MPTTGWGTPATPESPHVGMLCWLFYRNHDALACDLVVNGNTQFVVQVTPLWDGAESVCETFGRPMEALQRHAEIASFLRESGWLLAERGIVPSAA